MLLGVFTFVTLHRFPKTGVRAIANVLCDLLKRCVFCLHQLMGNAHANGHKLLAKASSRILQNKSFGVSLGNVKLIGKVGKIYVLIVVENEKLADKEIVILDFGYRVVLLMIEITKQRDLKRKKRQKQLAFVKEV